MSGHSLNFEQELERTRNVESAANALSMGIWGDWKNGDFGDVNDPRSKKIIVLIIIFLLAIICNYFFQRR